MTTLEAELHGIIGEIEPTKFKNAIAVKDKETIIIYSMNRKYEIREILIDIEDLPRIVERYSSISLCGGGYPIGHRRIDGVSERLHRYLLGDIPKGLVCDHINGVRCDITKLNLRIVTKAENRYNIHKVNAKSGVRNVVKMPNGRYRVRVCKGGEEFHIGVFATIEEADRKACEARLRLFGHV